jgi:hypothetical protein
LHKYKLVVAKGDLLDQRRKLHNSGLGHYFHHIEVMSDKQEVDYSDLRRLEIKPSEFFMIGNLKSDGFSYWRTCRTIPPLPKMIGSIYMKFQGL